LAHSLSLEMHEWWVCQTRRRLLRMAKLSRDDMRLLAMENQGLQTKLISRALGLSIAAVNSRFRLINVKLLAPNRKAPASRAATHGLL
jgi:DNA-binding NarL/FixJ family response regulator